MSLQDSIFDVNHILTEYHPECLGMLEDIINTLDYFEEQFTKLQRDADKYNSLLDDIAKRIKSDDSKKDNT